VRDAHRTRYVDLFLIAVEEKGFHATEDRTHVDQPQGLSGDGVIVARMKCQSFALAPVHDTATNRLPPAAPRRDTRP